MKDADRKKASGLLLAWYDRHRRKLPWRAPPGKHADPYRVWLSEIMLQQTTVAAVIPYYREFTRRWPTLASLAAAPLDEVLACWAGLGYYARARNLHRCAGTVLTRHGGRFPSEEAALLALPGIGRYTEAAIRAIAFDAPALPIDGNVKRVIARLAGIERPLARIEPEVRAALEGLRPAGRHGDFAQALMDLGATICRPRNPDCPSCPWQTQCVAATQGRAEVLPIRSVRPARPILFAQIFWLEDSQGRVWLERRPNEGLLGGMWEFPSSPWEACLRPRRRNLAGLPKLHWQKIDGSVRHEFTHRVLELTLYVGRGDCAPDRPGRFVESDQLATSGLPSLMRKVARLASHRRTESARAAAPGGNGRSAPSRRSS